MDLRTKEKCTLSDKELLDKCNEWIDRLIRSGGREWTLRVPVDLNHDPDMLFVELMNRFKALSLIQGEAADQKSLEDFREKLHKAMSEELAYALGIDHADVHVQEALDGGWPLIAQREAAKDQRIAELEAELDSVHSKYIELQWQVSEALFGEDVEGYDQDEVLQAISDLKESTEHSRRSATQAHTDYLNRIQDREMQIEGLQSEIQRLTRELEIWKDRFVNARKSRKHWFMMYNQTLDTLGDKIKELEALKAQPSSQWVAWQERKPAFGVWVDLFVEFFGEVCNVRLDDDGLWVDYNGDYIFEDGTNYGPPILYWIERPTPPQTPPNGN